MQRITLFDVVDSVYVPGASVSEKSPVESVCVVRPPGDAVIVASVTGRGGHGCPACSTGHVGPAAALPSAPLPEVYAVVGPGVFGGGVTDGAFVISGDDERAVGGDAFAIVGDGVGDDEPDARWVAVVCEHAASSSSVTTAAAR